MSKSTFGIFELLAVLRSVGVGKFSEIIMTHFPPPNRGHVRGQVGSKSKMVKCCRVISQIIPLAARSKKIYSLWYFYAWKLIYDVTSGQRSNLNKLQNQ